VYYKYLSTLTQSRLGMELWQQFQGGCSIWGWCQWRWPRYWVLWMGMQKEHELVWQWLFPGSMLLGHALSLSSADCNWFVKCDKYDLFPSWLLPGHQKDEHIFYLFAVCEIWAHVGKRMYVCVLWGVCCSVSACRLVSVCALACISVCATLRQSVH